MRFRVKILIRWILHLFFLLHLCAAAVNAASLTWTGLGVDNLASNPTNWTGNVVPKYGDDILFDATSGKDCTWDFDVTLSSFRITPAYTGTVTNNAARVLYGYDGSVQSFASIWLYMSERTEQKTYGIKATRYFFICYFISLKMPS